MYFAISGLLARRNMQLYSATLLAIMAALLSSVENAAVCGLSKTTTANSPAKFRMLPGNQVGISSSRLLRVSVANDKRSEDRMMNAVIEKLKSVVMAGASKVHGDVDWKSLLAGEQSADEILSVFQLKDGIKSALFSPRLKSLERYVREVNTRNQNSQMSVIGVFTRHYGDDEVAKALVTAQKDAQTKGAFNTIRQLRKDQLSNWLASEKSVDDVFTLLRLREDGYQALASPKMEVLDDYLKLVIRTYSGKETVLQTLTKGFGGEDKLAKILLIAKDDASTSELAAALQNALLNKWMASKMQPESVLKRLSVDSSLEDTLFGQTLPTLAAFILKYNSRNPSSKASLIGTISAHYGDDVVAKTLFKFRSNDATKDLASSMQIQQFNQWLTSKKSADDVLKLLKINSNEFLEQLSPKLEVLSEYITALKTVNPRENTDVFTVVSNSFGGEGGLARTIVAMMEKLEMYNVDTATYLGTVYQKALFKRWFRNDIEPESIYTKFLKVDAASAGALDIAVVTRYTSYYNKKMAPPPVFTFNDPRR